MQTLLKRAMIELEVARLCIQHSNVGYCYVDIAFLHSGHCIDLCIRSLLKHENIIYKDSDSLLDLYQMIPDNYLSDEWHIELSSIVSYASYYIVSGYNTYTSCITLSEARTLINIAETLLNKFITKFDF